MVSHIPCTDVCCEMDQPDLSGISANINTNVKSVMYGHNVLYSSNTVYEMDQMQMQKNMDVLSHASFPIHPSCLTYLCLSHDATGGK